MICSPVLYSYISRVMQTFLIPKGPLVENVYKVPALMISVIFRATQLKSKDMFSVLLSQIFRFGSEHRPSSTVMKSLMLSNCLEGQFSRLPGWSLSLYWLVVPTVSKATPDPFHTHQLSVPAHCFISLIETLNLMR